MVCCTISRPSQSSSTQQRYFTLQKQEIKTSRGHEERKSRKKRSGCISGPVMNTFKKKALRQSGIKSGFTIPKISHDSCKVHQIGSNIHQHEEASFCCIYRLLKPQISYKEMHIVKKYIPLIITERFAAWGVIVVMV